MPRYAGDQILQGGDNVSTTALNYRKTDRSSNFGTRKLAFYSIQMSPDFDLAANYADNNSLYYQIVRAIQQGSYIGGTNGFKEGDGTILGGGGGGAELFYVGTPQNSASSPLNQQDNYVGIRSLNTTGTVTVSAASGTGSIATLTFASAQPTPPFNVGDPVQVTSVGSGYDCYLNELHFVTECTTTYVKYNSTATATLTSLEGSVYADLGYDCFTFAIVDDAEPFLPEGSGNFGAVDYTGVAGDSECFCCTSGRHFSTIVPFNFWFAIYQVLQDNELNTGEFNIYRLKDSAGLLPY
jgi:hypothetical protein